MYWKLLQHEMQQLSPRDPPVDEFTEPAHAIS